MHDDNPVCANIELIIHGFCLGFTQALWSVIKPPFMIAYCVCFGSFASLLRPWGNKPQNVTAMYLAFVLLNSLWRTLGKWNLTYVLSLHTVTDYFSEVSECSLWFTFDLWSVTDLLLFKFCCIPFWLPVYCCRQMPNVLSSLSHRVPGTWGLFISFRFWPLQHIILFANCSTS